MMNEFSNINERILHIIENQYNANQKKFAESIGYSAQVVFNIVSGRKTKPSYDVLLSIISTNDDIDIEWLLTGKGSMLKGEETTSAPIPETSPDKNLEYIIDLQKDKIRQLEREVDQLKKDAESTGYQPRAAEPTPELVRKRHK